MICCKILWTLLFFIFEGKAFFFLIVRNTIKVIIIYVVNLNEKFEDIFSLYV